jgi:anti-sigma factor RsiW
MTVLRGWGLPEQHLALDALVAFVDGELSPSAYDRASAHLARCPACAADAAAQRQARAEVRSAAAPSISPQLLRALRSIPSDADLPGQPDELALTEDGQLVTVARRDRAGALGGSARLGSSTPLGGAQSFASRTPLGGETQATSQPRQNRVGYGRRTRQGASVVFSGLVLGALAFMNVPADEEPEPASPPPPPFLDQVPGESAVPAAVARPAAPQAPAAPPVAAHPQASTPEVLPAVDTPSQH